MQNARASRLCRLVEFLYRVKTKSKPLVVTTNFVLHISTRIQRRTCKLPSFAYNLDVDLSRRNQVQLPDDNVGIFESWEIGLGQAGPLCSLSYGFALCTSQHCLALQRTNWNLCVARTYTCKELKVGHVLSFETNPIAVSRVVAAPPDRVLALPACLSSAAALQTPPAASL